MSIQRLLCATGVLLRLTLAGLAAALVGAADADNTWVRVLKNHTVVEVERDGRYSADRMLALKLVSEEGTRRLGQMAMNYNPDLNELEVLEAWVEKPDGRRVDVDLKTGLFDRSQNSGLLAPMLTQDRFKLLVYPDLQVGDILHRRTRQRVHTPLFPGQFSELDTYSRDVLVDDYRYELRAPKDWPLNIEVEAMEAEPVREQGNQRIHVWRYRNQTRIAQEAGELSPLLSGPRLLISSFRDYADLATAFHKRSADKSRITPEIQKLADEVTQGISDRRQQAFKLYEWVSRNIRYVAIYVGAGGVVPMSAEQVLSQRYGDCKGHVVLLEALLAAKGIASTGALVDGSGRLYRLPKVAFLSFDHIITYIPEFDLWLDSTATFVPYGTLPLTETGKPALLVNSGEIKRIPHRGPLGSAVSRDAEIVLQRDGNAAISVRFTVAGPSAQGLRSGFATIQPRTRQDFTGDWMNRSGLNGSGQLVDLGDPYRLDRDFSYALRGQVLELAPVPGPYGFALPNLDAPLTIRNWVGGYLKDLGPRRTEYVCSNEKVSERTVLRLPRSSHIQFLPRDVRLQSGPYRYLASYRRDGNKVTVRREFVADYPEPICPADEWNRHADFFRGIARDLRAQVIYR
ncbi:DUF3857 domain-containing transglutaminase family protein [Chitinimonas lacunae]|uniref:DUF3857 domain-containing transglutaminase family protein n=1 Tax=Chitinimonas lacunae TaxID=1963018 RepID=A0ABV8MQ56_9NEIS